MRGEEFDRLSLIPWPLAAAGFNLAQVASVAKRALNGAGAWQSAVSSVESLHLAVCSWQLAACSVQASVGCNKSSTCRLCSGKQMQARVGPAPAGLVWRGLQVWQRGHSMTRPLDLARKSPPTPRASKIGSSVALRRVIGGSCGCSLQLAPAASRRPLGHAR